MPRWTYQTANEFLVDRRKLHGNIASYTNLERDGDMIVMKLGQFKHGGREIVRLHPDGRIQLTQCWNGPSIRDRMNWCLPGWHRGQHIGNERGYWFLRIRRDRPAPDQYDTYSFKDGITLHPDGTVTGYDPEPFADKIKNHLAAIRKRNAIHTVESAGGFTVGDVVFQDHHRYDYATKKTVQTSTGPYRVTRIRASQNRTVLWLTNLDGSLVLDPDGGKMYHGVSVKWNKFRRDKFLSAVSQATRNPVTKERLRVILDFSNSSTYNLLLQRLASDVAAIPVA